MKKLTDLYYSTPEHERHLILGTLLTVVGLLLLITKAIAGTPSNSQEIAGFVIAMHGIILIWQEMGK